MGIFFGNLMNIIFMSLSVNQMKEGQYLTAFFDEKTI